MKKEITIKTKGEANVKDVFFHIKQWCVINFQEFHLIVKGKNKEDKEEILEHKQEKN